MTEQQAKNQMKINLEGLRKQKEKLENELHQVELERTASDI